MRYRRLFFVTGLLCALAACEPSDRTTEQPSSDTEAPPAMTTQPVEADIAYPGGAFVRHMHLHAAQLERLYAALDAGDLEAAGAPAYWLSRHETMPSLPDSWRPYVVNMRLAAKTVEDATDLDTARAAADRLADNCRDCHEAAGK